MITNCPDGVTYVEQLIITMLLLYVNTSRQINDLIGKKKHIYNYFSRYSTQFCQQNVTPHCQIYDPLKNKITTSGHIIM